MVRPVAHKRETERSMQHFRFRVPIAMNMKIANFWGVMTCNLVEVRRCLAT
jgi:hypothetical protein